MKLPEPVTGLLEPVAVFTPLELSLPQTLSSSKPAVKLTFTPGINLEAQAAAGKTTPPTKPPKKKLTIKEFLAGRKKRAASPTPSLPQQSNLQLSDPYSVTTSKPSEPPSKRQIIEEQVDIVEKNLPMTEGSEGSTKNDLPLPKEVAVKASLPIILAVPLSFLRPAPTSLLTYDVEALAKQEKML